MKRAISNEKVSAKRYEAKDTKRFDDQVKKAYKVFPSEGELRMHMEVDENIWDIYSAKDFGIKEMKDFDDAQRNSFESYVSGWLQYYDEVGRNKGIDHTLHFNYRDVDVVVYISPAPGNSLNPITAPSATATSSTSDPKSPTIPPPPLP